MSIDKPQLLVSLAADLGEHIRRVGIAEPCGLIDCLACGLAECRRVVDSAWDHWVVGFASERLTCTGPMSLPGSGTRVGYATSPEQVKSGKESVNLVNTIGPTVPVMLAEAEPPLRRHRATR